MTATDERADDGWVIVDGCGDEVDGGRALRFADLDCG
jgi:hypothetical protein